MEGMGLIIASVDKGSASSHRVWRGIIGLPIKLTSMEISRCICSRSQEVPTLPRGTKIIAALSETLAASISVRYAGENSK